MARLSYALIPFALLAAVGCSSKSSGNTPDAPVITTTDAPPPIDAMPDALVCTAPEKACSGACVNVDSDEQNCGDCGVVCQGGAYCKPQPDGCTCPGNFLPADVPVNGQDQHQSQSVGGSNIHIAVAPIDGGTQLNGLLFISVGIPQMNHDYALKSGISFSQPNVFAAYNVQLGGTVPSADAQYEATAGTLRFTTAACDANGFEFKGTITGATFSGAMFSGQNVTIDPNGCTFDVANLTFDIKVATACTP